MERALERSSPELHRAAPVTLSADRRDGGVVEHTVQRQIFRELCFAGDVFGKSSPFFLETPQNDSQKMKISEQRA